jgi:hypothetical protein
MSSTQYRKAIVSRAKISHSITFVWELGVSFWNRFCSDTCEASELMPIRKTGSCRNWGFGASFLYSKNWRGINLS